MTPREYAASLGLAQAGARGRLSREAHAAIEKAKAGGMVFDDPRPVVTREPKAPKPVKPVSVSRETGPVVAERVSAQTVGDTFVRYTMDTLFTGTDSHGKEFTVDARQVCRNCQYSLCSHRCANPEVLVHSMEFIKVTPKGR